MNNKIILDKENQPKSAKTIVLLYTLKIKAKKNCVHTNMQNFDLETDFTPFIKIQLKKCQLKCKCKAIKLPGDTREDQDDFGFASNVLQISPKELIHESKY